MIINPVVLRALIQRERESSKGEEHRPITLGMENFVQFGMLRDFKELKGIPTVQELIVYVRYMSEQDIREQLGEQESRALEKIVAITAGECLHVEAQRLN